jgi:hypothetical protein
VTPKSKTTSTVRADGSFVSVECQGPALDEDGFSAQHQYAHELSALTVTDYGHTDDLELYTCRLREDISGARSGYSGRRNTVRETATEINKGGSGVQRCISNCEGLRQLHRRDVELFNVHSLVVCYLPQLIHLSY